MKSMFRYLVIFSMTFYIFWYFLPHLTYQFGIYSNEVSDILSWTGFDAYFSLKAQDIIGPLFLLSYALVSIGLYQFKNWAKKSFIGLTIISILSTPLFGVVILPPYEALFGNIIGLLDGIIISLMYFSSLRNEFN